jgi:putative aminopeptidase FrvX
MPVRALSSLVAIRAAATVVALTTGLSELAAADTADRLRQLVATPGVSGYEADVRGAIEMLLPAGARLRADNQGNILIRTGNGIPHTLIVAPLDESGLVVSAITDEGYLRVHRHTTAPGPPVATQFVLGQPVEVRTASGRIVPGVAATPSAHLRGFRDRQDEVRLKTLDDLWIDVGVESRAEVESLGIRLLDSVTLRERATRLAGTRVSGVAASNRATALAVAEIIRRSSGRGAIGSVTFAWATQAEYGSRGLLRLMETLQPDRLIVLRGAGRPGNDPRGSIGRLGAGPLVVDRDAMLTPAAQVAGVAIQALPDAHARLTLPEKWLQVEKHVVSVPVRFAHTPVETVDARDVDALAALLAAAVGLPPLAEPDATGAEGATEPPPRREADAAERRSSPAAPRAETDSRNDPLLETLGALIETYGVSGHEAPVRAEILKRLPAWAKPRVDERGNVTVSFGHPKGKSLLFIAHMDEVGFEITAIAEDGTARVRSRGGMYLSVYEAHPVVVQTVSGPVAAVLAPRQGYTTAAESQPDIEGLSLDFGTETAAETRALGVDVGQSATVRKQFVPLGPHRATGRSMDDRNGSAALLAALARIDPAAVPNAVTFAWSVEEETGLAGAEHLADTLRPDTVFAVDTFVSSDTPVDVQRLAGARLGGGAVLRVLDSRTIVSPGNVDRIVGLAAAAKIPLQLGTTSGGTDASAFAAGGAVDIGLSWPGRYSHSPIEVMDRRDLEALIRLIVELARGF